MKDGVGRLHLRKYKLALIVDEHDADIGLDLFPDFRDTLNRCLAGVVVTGTRLQRGLLCKVLAAPHLYEFVERIELTLEPMLSLQVGRNAQHPLIRGCAE